MKKNIKDYIGKKFALQCNSEEEWDKILKLSGSSLRNYYNNAGENKCINLYDPGTYWGVGSVKHILKTHPGYQILQAADFIYEGKAVECKTKEEWDFLNGKLNQSKDFSFMFKCLNLETFGFGSRDFYEQEGFLVISFDEWCKENNYEMKVKLKELPEKWCIKSTYETHGVIGGFWDKCCNLRNIYTNLRYENKYFYSHNLFSGGSIFSDDTGSNHTNEILYFGFTEIPYEDFERLVLNKNIYSNTVNEVIMAKDEFILPKIWCIKVTPKSRPYIKKYRKSIKYTPYEIGDYKYQSLFCGIDSKHDKYELTLTQFIRYVLKEEICAELTWDIDANYVKGPLTKAMLGLNKPQEDIVIPKLIPIIRHSSKINLEVKIPDLNIKLNKNTPKVIKEINLKPFTINI